MSAHQKNSPHPEMHRPVIAFKIIFLLTLILFVASLFIHNPYSKILENQTASFALRIADLTTFLVLALFLRIQARFEKGHEIVCLFAAAVFCIAVFTVLSLLRFYLTAFEWELTLGSLLAGLILNFGWFFPKKTIIKISQYYPAGILILGIVTAFSQLTFLSGISGIYKTEDEFNVWFKVLNISGSLLIFSGCYYFYLLSKNEDSKVKWIQSLIYYTAIGGLIRLVAAFSETKDIQFIIGSLRLISNMTAVYYLVWIYQHTLLELQSKNELLVQNQILIEEQRVKMFHSAQMASVARLSGVFAHEINNPMASISLNTELILKKHKGELSQDEESKLLKILQLTKRVSEIIKRFTALSLIRETDVSQKTKLKDIVMDTVNVCGNTLPNNLEFKVDPIPDVVLTCKPARISQALLNVLLNSFEAVKHLEEKWVHIFFEDHKDKILIRVVDSGNGISPEIADKMMNPFFTTKDVNEGHGLGLSIAKTYIEEHHGQLYYDKSSPHTCFVIELSLEGRQT